MLRAMLVACASLAFLGCDDATGPDRSPVGSWALVEIGGQPLPYQNGNTDIISIEQTLRADGTFTRSGVFHFFAAGRPGGFVVRRPELDGRWELEGSRLRFTSEDEGEDPLANEAAYDGDRIVFGAGDSTSVFLRR